MKVDSERFRFLGRWMIEILCLQQYKFSSCMPITFADLSKMAQGAFEIISETRVLWENT